MSLKKSCVQLHLMQTQKVAASEIGEYVYCKRAWWLKQQGNETTTPAMLRGILEHNALSKLLSTLKKDMTITLIIILLAIGLLLLLVTYIFIR